MSIFLRRESMLPFKELAFQCIFFWCKLNLGISSEMHNQLVMQHSN